MAYRYSNPLFFNLPSIHSCRLPVYSPSICCGMSDNVDEKTSAHSQALWFCLCYLHVMLQTCRFYYESNHICHCLGCWQNINFNTVVREWSGHCETHEMLGRSNANVAQYVAATKTVARKPAPKSLTSTMRWRFTRFWRVRWSRWRSFFTRRVWTNYFANCGRCQITGAC